MYSLRFDGLFRGIPGNDKLSKKAGFLCYGWIICEADVIIAQGHGAYACGLNASSNVAEYLALIEGLEALSDLGIGDKPVIIYGDAKCVIDQMRGAANVNSGTLWPHYDRAMKLANSFLDLDWVWMPRKYNKAADWLTRRAMKQVRYNRKDYQQAVDVISPNGQKKKRKLLPLYDLRIFHKEIASYIEQ
jgi:ribonuclease HI